MRLTRRNFDVRVKLRTGPRPVILAFGLCAFEATPTEARDLAVAIVDALEQLERGGGG